MVCRFTDLIHDSKQGIQGCHGILKDHSHVTAADIPQFTFADFHEILAVKFNGAPDNLSPPGSNRKMAWQVVVLPQPDSPTRPRVSPWSKEKLMPSTTFTSLVPLKPVNWA